MLMGRGLHPSLLFWPLKIKCVQTQNFTIDNTTLILTTTTIPPLDFALLPTSSNPMKEKECGY